MGVPAGRSMQFLAEPVILECVLKILHRVARCPEKEEMFSLSLHAKNTFFLLVGKLVRA